MRSILAAACLLAAALPAHAADRINLRCSKFEVWEKGLWKPDEYRAEQVREIFFDAERGGATNAGEVNDVVTTGSQVVVAGDRLIVALYYSIFENSDVDVTRIEYYRTGDFEGVGHVYWSELVDDSGVGPDSGVPPRTTRAKCDVIK